MKELVIEIEGLASDHDVVVTLKKELTISADLDRECRHTPSQFGYYAVLSEKAEARVKRTKLALEEYVAEAEAKIIEDAGGRSKFKAAKDLTREVAKLPRYHAFKRKIVQFEEEAGIMHQIAKAFELKKDLIQTMAADRRKEIG